MGRGCESRCTLPHAPHLRSFLPCRQVTRRRRTWRHSRNPMFKDTDRLAYYAMILPGLLLLFAFTFVPAGLLGDRVPEVQPGAGRAGVALGRAWTTSYVHVQPARRAPGLLQTPVFIAIDEDGFCARSPRLRRGAAAERGARPAHPALGPDDGLPAALPFVGDPGRDPAHDPGARRHDERLSWVYFGVGAGLFSGPAQPSFPG
jgi:hypothetical protein